MHTTKDRDQCETKMKNDSKRTFVKNLIYVVTVIKHHDAYFSQRALWNVKVAFSISGLRLISSKTQLVQMKAYETRPEESTLNQILAFRVKAGDIRWYSDGFIKLAQYLNASYSYYYLHLLHADSHVK